MNPFVLFLLQLCYNSGSGKEKKARKAIENRTSPQEKTISAYGDLRDHPGIRGPFLFSFNAGYNPGYEIISGIPYLLHDKRKCISDQRLA